MQPAPVSELMTPDEAARWFRRSPSWLRQQQDVLRLGIPHGQPLYHVNACRAYLLGRRCGLRGTALLQVQLQALAAVCGLSTAELLDDAADGQRVGAGASPKPPEVSEVTGGSSIGMGRCSAS